MVEDLRFRVEDLGFRGEDLGFRVEDVGFRVYGLGFEFGILPRFRFTAKGALERLRDLVKVGILAKR